MNIDEATRIACGAVLPSKSKKREQMYYRHLRSQYKQFLDENKKRQERNERILRLLERIEMRASMLEAKTERYNFLRKQYYSFLNRVRSRSVPPKLSAPPPPPPPQIELTRREFNEKSYQPNHASTIADEIMSSIYSKRRVAKSAYDKLLKPKDVRWTPNNFGYTSEVSNVNSESEEDGSAWRNRRQYYGDNKKYLSERSSLGYPTPSTNIKRKSANDDVDVGTNFTVGKETPLLQIDVEVKVDSSKDVGQNSVKEEKMADGSKDVRQNGILKSALVEEVPGVVAQEVKETYGRLVQRERNDNVEDLGLNGQALVEDIDAKYNENMGQTYTTNLPGHQTQGGLHILEDNNTQIFDESNQLIQDNLDNIKSELQDPLTTDEGNKRNDKDVEPLDNQQFGEDIEQMQYHANGACDDREQHQVEHAKTQNEKSGEVLQYDSNKKSTKLDSQENSELVQCDAPTVQYEASEESKINEATEEPIQIDAKQQLLHADEDGQPGPNPAIEQPLQSDADGQPVQQTVGQAPQYAANGEPSQENGNAQQFQLEKSDVSGQQIQYDETGQPIICDPNNQQLQYDENGQPINYTDNQELQYDVKGEPLQYNENEQPTNYTDHQQLQYDEKGEPVQYNTEQQYDENGQPIHYPDNNQQYDENEQQIHYDTNNQPLQYDENGQPINYTDKLQYDENGQPLQYQTDENGQPLQYQTEQQYDENGQPIQYDEYNRQINYDENGHPYYYDESGNAVFYEQYEQSETAPDSSEAAAVVEASKPNVVELLETDTESSKQDANKVSNDSDFDFSSK